MDEPAHLHFDVHFCLRALSSNFQTSDESHELAWVPLEEIPNYSKEESLLRMQRLTMNRGSTGRS